MISKPLRTEGAVGFDPQIAKERTLSLFGLFARDWREDEEGVKLLTNFDSDQDDEDSNIEDREVAETPI